MFGFSNYNYDRFRKTTLIKDMAKSQFGAAPEPGDEAPDFTLRTVDGDKIALSDFEGKKNVLLTFGSATCPQTAASIGGIQDLYNEFSPEVQFLFVYVREAHPGDDLPAHRSMKDKARAAEMLRDEEELEMPMLVDDLGGKVHRKYGSMPNPSFLIDKSGRVAYRSLSSRPASLRAALEELIETQEERDADHAVVNGGEDTAMPPLNMFLHAHRALERGGDEALDNFRGEMGLPGRIALTGGRVARPLIEHPVATAATVGAVAGVAALGLWVGLQLRKKRFESMPYSIHRTQARRPDDDYAVGI